MSTELHPRTDELDPARSISRINNFDLLRILAALQVVFGHTLSNLDIRNTKAAFINRNIVAHFPGVPIFFVVSGFLIYWSFDRNSTNIRKFYWHRVLRIFPALWTCLAVTVLLILTQSQIGPLDFLTVPKLGVWLGGQLAIFQFYTPEILRSWATGVPNGALWTIAVEVEFYILIPVLVLLSRLMRGRWNQVIGVLVLASITTNWYVSTLDPDGQVRKLGEVFLLTYLYYFLFGVLSYKYWPTIRRYVNGTFLYWISGYVTYFLVFSTVLGLYSPSYFAKNPYNVVAHVLLAGVTLSCAFSFTGFSRRLLRGYDVSYGVYIYHLLIINTLVNYGYTGSVWYILVTLLGALVAGAVSWVAVERRALRYKSRGFGARPTDQNRPALL